MSDDAKRLEEVERVQRDHARRINELESGARRQKSEIENSVRDMTSAAIRHIEGLTRETSKKFDDIKGIGESTLALNRVQTETLEDVKAELEKARIAERVRFRVERLDRKKRADEERAEKERARAEERAAAATIAAKKYETSVKLKKLAGYTAFIAAIGGLLTYLIAAAYVSQHHAMPERPDTHEEREK